MHGSVRCLFVLDGLNSLCFSAMIDRVISFIAEAKRTNATLLLLISASTEGNVLEVESLPDFHSITFSMTLGLFFGTNLFLNFFLVVVVVDFIGEGNIIDLTVIKLID